MTAADRMVVETLASGELDAALDRDAYRTLALTAIHTIAGYEKRIAVQSATIQRLRDELARYTSTAVAS